MHKIDRKIPNIMGTQHPDNAGVPFFKGDQSKNPFITPIKRSTRPSIILLFWILMNICGIGKANTPMRP